MLANQLRDSGYDLRAALAFIATSEAYQARAEVLAAVPYQMDQPAGPFSPPLVWVLQVWAPQASYPRS